MKIVKDILLGVVVAIVGKVVEGLCGVVGEGQCLVGVKVLVDGVLLKEINIQLFRQINVNLSTPMFALHYLFRPQCQLP